MKHPLHPVVVHFPIALCSISVLWDIAALVTREPAWWGISFWDIAAGVALAVVAATLGLVDMMKLGETHPATTTAYIHMSVVLAAVFLFGGSLLVRYPVEPLSGSRLIYALLLSWTGFVAILAGGWFGGRLVYHYGVGVEAGRE